MFHMEEEMLTSQVDFFLLLLQCNTESFEIHIVRELTSSKFFRLVLIWYTVHIQIQRFTPLAPSSIC